MGPPTAAAVIDGWTIGASSSPGNTDLYQYKYTGNPASIPGDGTGSNNGVLLNSGFGGNMSQTISGLTPGIVDILTIDFWGSNSTTAKTVSLNVTINGVLHTATESDPGGISGTYGVYTLSFTPTSGSSLLTLAGIQAANSAGPVVGYVSIVSTPEPASALLLLVPAAGFLLRRRKQRKS